jgi:leader peptidase (prepilin peptidase)/N-methyltransferase
MAGAIGVLGLLGATVGSFLNVVVHRLPRRESLVKPRSRCPGCGLQVRALDNIPVFSWLALRGRCRGCGERISVRYPLVELMTAAVFAAVAMSRGLELELVVLLPFAAMLLAVAAIDLEHRIVPNRIVAPMAVYGVAASAVVRPGELPELLIAGAAAFLALLLAAVARPGGMGMGDVKLAGVMGLYLGSAVAPALLAAFLSGTLVGVAIMIRAGKDARKQAVPFAPFLALGGLLGLLAGPELIDFYRDNFLS